MVYEKEGKTMKIENTKKIHRNFWYKKTESSVQQNRIFCLYARNQMISEHFRGTKNNLEVIF